MFFFVFQRAFWDYFNLYIFVKTLVYHILGLDGARSTQRFHELLTPRDYLDIGWYQYLKRGNV